MDKELFFKSSKPKVVPVVVTGTTYYVKHLSITETLAFEQSVKKQSSADNAVAVLIACVCDSDGNNILSEDDTEQVKQIDSNVAVALYKAALSHNQMDEGEIDALKKTEEQSAPDVYLSDGETSQDDS